MKLTAFLTVACVSCVGVTAITGTSPRPGADGSKSGSSPADTALYHYTMINGQQVEPDSKTHRPQATR